MNNHVDRRVKKTRKLLKNVLVETLQTNELADITVKELCGKADINRSTFYLHYDNVYDLWNCIENEVIEQINGILSKYKADVVLTKPLPLILDVTKFLEQEKLFNRKLFQSRESFMLLEKIKNCFIRFFLDNCSIKTPAENQENLDLYITFVISGAVSLFYKWFLGETDISLNRLAYVIEKLITGGVEDFFKGTLI